MKSQMSDITDAELRRRLKKHGFQSPPVTDTSRGILIRKLKLLEMGDTSRTPSSEAENTAEQDQTDDTTETEMNESAEEDAYESDTSDWKADPRNRRDVFVRSFDHIRPRDPVDGHADYHPQRCGQVEATKKSNWKMYACAMFVSVIATAFYLSSCEVNEVALV